MIVMTARSEVDEDEVSPHYWIPATFASGLMVLFTLVHAIIYVDGAVSIFSICNRHFYQVECLKTFFFLKNSGNHAVSIVMS